MVFGLVVALEAARGAGREKVASPLVGPRLEILSRQLACRVVIVTLHCLLGVAEDGFGAVVPNAPDAEGGHQENDDGGENEFSASTGKQFSNVIQSCLKRQNTLILYSAD